MQNNDQVRFHHDESDTELTGTIVRAYKTKVRVRIDAGQEHEGEVLSVAIDELLLDDAEDEDDEESGNAMSRMLAKYRGGYEPSVSASGRKSLHNGDELAAALEYKTHQEVVAMAERALDLEPGSLVAKYGHLNNGQQRMCAGNRLRAAYRRGEIQISDLQA